MQIKQSPGTVTVNQSNNIDDCLERFGLAECKPVSTPVDISVQLSKKYCPEASSAAAVSMKAEYYRGIVGSLFWKTIKSDLLARKFQLPDILSGSRQQAENGYKEQKK